MQENKNKYYDIAERIYDLDGEVYECVGSSLGRTFTGDKRTCVDNLVMLMRTKPQGHLLRSELALISNMARTIRKDEDRSRLMKRYDDILKEVIGTNINSRSKLLSIFQEYNDTREEFEQYKTALKMVKSTGYGIAVPTIKDMKLDTPEVVKQGGRYGVKLKAVAPSIHMIRVDVESTFEPIIGSELQSKELISYLTKNQEEGADNIWKSEIFGRSLDEIVQEGIQAKLSLMPENLRYKLQNTLGKVVNKGSNNMIAIVL